MTYISDLYRAAGEKWSAIPLSTLIKDGTFGSLDDIYLCFAHAQAISEGTGTLYRQHEEKGHAYISSRNGRER